MDKTKLKDILISQKIPFEEAVQQKISYLTGDNVFEDDSERYDNLYFDEEESIENAFEQINDIPEQSNKFYSFTEKASPEKENNTANRTQSMAEKIAALRGISISSDYINYKKS